MEQTPVERALTLLGLAGSEPGASHPARASIGERDRRLLDLREALFGEELQGTAACPRCGEWLEVAFRTEDARVAPAERPGRDGLLLEVGGHEIRCRLPNSADLLEIGDAGPRGRHALLQRCIEEVRCGGDPIEGGQLPEELVSAAAEAMAEADPQAVAEVLLTCPGCDHRWPVAFDIASYLWTEIEAWAQRLVHDVHSLATAYGWSERDILALSAWRRARYLELAGS